MKLGKYGNVDTNDLFKSNEVKQAEKMVGPWKNKAERIRGIVTSNSDPISKVKNVLKTIDFKVKPNSPAGVMGAKNVPAARISGAVPAFIREVPDALCVEINSVSVNGTREDITIKALLQESVNISTRSHWETYNPLGDRITEHAQAISQIARVALTTRISTRRIWKGTEPLRLRLTLKFEAYEDAYKEVVLPNRDLQRMALPSGDGKWQEYAMLTPPGPYPFELTNPLSKEEGTGGIGDEITIRVGRLFTFNRVVITEISTTFSNRLDINGHPVSAETAVDFQTYEIYTKGMLETSYAGGSGNGSPASDAVKTG